jgi:hypothetical protein
VWARERREETALASLARARAESDRARATVSRASDAAQVDARAPGRVELWVLDDDEHRRAVEALREAEGDARLASSAEDAARTRYAAARRDALAVRRVQERRVAEALAHARRRERRELDEVAALRFTAARWSRDVR